MSAGKILTTGGFTKLLRIPQPAEDCKVVLYYLENPTSEKVKKAKDAILQELDKGDWTYQGDLKSFEQEIKNKNYLLREGKTLQLIEGNEISGKHQIKISNTASYLFQSLVKVGGNFNISGSNATVVLNLPPIPQESPLQSIINCPKSHSDFVGRASELKMLRDVFLSQRKPLDETVFHFLYGLGGVGKSELTKRFANTHQEDFFLIWFFSASSDQLLYEEYQKLAKTLKVSFSDQDKLDILQKRVHDHLASTSFPKPYLLIFDNIEKEIDSQMLPQRGGAILMTAREKEHWRDSSTLIKEFEEEEALTLFENVTKEKASDEMKKLSETLGRFPFLLNQVAHYISAESSTISEYLKYFDFKEEVSRDGRYKETFGTVWEITFKRLGEKHPLALDWLKVCAFLHPDEIPIHWLNGWLEEKNIENPPKERIGILGALRKYALIRECQEDSASISLHRLLQQALQSRVGDPSIFLLTVYRFIKKHSKNFDHKNGNHRWMPHAEKILEIMEENKLSIQEIEQEVHSCLGNTYYSLGEYRKALEYHEKCLEIVEKLGNQGDVGKTYENIGIVYKSLGEYRKALEYHEKSLAIAEKLGDQGGEGRAYCNIGNVYQSLGEYRKALEYHEKDLKIAEKLGDQGGVGVAYGNIGNAYNSLGKDQQALEYLEKCLKIAERLGDQGVVGCAYYNIGSAYKSLGEYRKALEYHEKYLAIAERLGDQRGVGRAYGNIGIAYQSLGEYQQARNSYEQAQTIAKKMGYRDVEKFVEAKLTKLNSSSGVAASLNADNSSSSIEKKDNALLNIVCDLSALEQPNEELIFEKVENIVTRIKAIEMHQDEMSGLLARAEALYERAYGNIGIAYQSLGEYQQARNSYEQAQTIAKKMGYRGVEKFVEAKLTKLNSSPDVAASLNADNSSSSIEKKDNALLNIVCDLSALEQPNEELIFEKVENIVARIIAIEVSQDEMSGLLARAEALYEKCSSD